MLRRLVMWGIILLIAFCCILPWIKGMLWGMVMKWYWWMVPGIL